MTLNLSSRRFAATLALALSLASIPALSMRPERHQDGASSASRTDTTARPSTTERSGEAKFRQNCSRCHQAPQGFSPKISGTILRHMRVRAPLSAQDERGILRFLNP